MWTIGIITLIHSLYTWSQKVILSELQWWRRFLPLSSPRGSKSSFVKLPELWEVSEVDNAISEMLEFSSGSEKTLSVELADRSRSLACLGISATHLGAIWPHRPHQKHTSSLLAVFSQWKSPRESLPFPFPLPRFLTYAATSVSLSSSTLIFSVKSVAPEEAWMMAWLVSYSLTAEVISESVGDFSRVMRADWTDLYDLSKRRRITSLTSSFLGSRLIAFSGCAIDRINSIKMVTGLEGSCWME
jgi:hypothetical protein